MNKQIQARLAESIKSTIEALPNSPRPNHGVDIGTMLTEAFTEAGYELQLHQHGVAGTSIVAVKIENVDFNIPTA